MSVDDSSESRYVHCFCIINAVDESSLRPLSPIELGSIPPVLQLVSRYSNIVVGRCGSLSARARVYLRPCSLFRAGGSLLARRQPASLHLPLATRVLSFSRTREAARRPRRAEPRGDALSRIESGRAAPSGAERYRAPGSSGAEGPAVGRDASSSTPPERVCACVRVLSAYSTRSVPPRSYSPPPGRESKARESLSSSRALSPSASTLHHRRRRRRHLQLPVSFSSRVYAASFPTGPRACMDDTRARADEDIALDSRLRSSARLGSAASIAAAAAAAAVTATAAAVATTTTSTTSSAAATCRVARRKRKKRRRQRLATSNDDVPGVTVVVTSRSATTSSSKAAVAEGTSATAVDAAADAVVVLEPDADAAVADADAANAATAETDPAAARVDKLRSRLLGEQHTAAGGEVQQLRVGGSGTRAAASSVGTAGVTLLNRRAGKRSPRRCNAGGRRSAMTMDLQRLINEVHARPAIWDQKNVNYHNRDVILKMWREIARACEVSSEYEDPVPTDPRTTLSPPPRGTYSRPCNTFAYVHVWVAGLVGRPMGGWDTLNTSRLVARSVQCSRAELTTLRSFEISRYA